MLAPTSKNRVRVATPPPPTQRPPESGWATVSSETGSGPVHPAAQLVDQPIDGDPHLLGAVTIAHGDGAVVE